MGSRGFDTDHVSVAVSTLREDIASWTSRLRGALAPDMSTDPIQPGAWRHLTEGRAALPA